MRELNTALIHIDEYVDLLTFKKELTKKHSVAVYTQQYPGYRELTYVSKDKAIIDLKNEIDRLNNQLIEASKEKSDYINQIQELTVKNISRDTENDRLK